MLVKLILYPEEKIQDFMLVLKKGCIIFGVDEEILHSHLFLYKKIETYEFFR